MSVALVVLLVGGGSGAAWGYDHATSDVLQPETRIGGVAVGGLTTEQAVERLRAELEAPLHEPLRVTSHNFEVETTPWDLGLQVDVEGAVREAHERQRSGSLPERLWQRLAGEGQRMPLEPELDHGPVGDLVETAAAHARVEPVDARRTLEGGRLEVTPHRYGHELDREAAERRLRRAVEGGAGEVELPVRSLSPGVHTSELGPAILIDTGSNRLYLYDGARVARQYPVATGQASHPTPTGTFDVGLKRYMPSWNNPGSAWAQDLPDHVPPGPDNPLGTRALNLGNTLYRIHGTSERASVGEDASRGCVRMFREDVEELYELVEVGTPVYIVRT